jgi:bile acid-coenzyme A ligase
LRSVELSISRIISWHADRDPDRPVVTDDGRSLTRRELDLRTNRLARAYAGLGVEQGDMVTVALPNGAEFVEACVAIWKLGAIPQPVSWRAPQPERDAIVELADSRLVVGVDDESHPTRITLPTAFEPDPSLSDDQLPDAVAPYWKAPTSGGSTGRPKLIVAGQPGMFDPDLPQSPTMAPEETQLVPGPLYHNGPFMYAMRGLMLGHHLVVMPRFDAQRALELIGVHRVEWVLLVPTMMSRIWRLPDDVKERSDLSSLRGIVHLAAPCPPWLKHAWIEWLGPERVLEIYAGTEGQGVTIIDGVEWLRKPGSVGKPTMGSHVRVLDPVTHEELRPDEVGEIFMLPEGGTGSTYHYVGAEPRRTADGWDSIGDLGWLDEDGYLFLADRGADLIITGGSNVYPAEVEAALESHPAVRTVVVVGLPDDDLGERVHALIDAVEPLEEDALRAHAAEQLVPYKVPRTFEFVDEPLRDDAGKVRRLALREERIAREGAATSS